MMRVEDVSDMIYVDTDNIPEDPIITAPNQVSEVSVTQDDSLRTVHLENSATYNEIIVDVDPDNSSLTDSIIAEVIDARKASNGTIYGTLRKAIIEQASLGRVRLIEEVNTLSVSDKGFIYIDTSNIKKPIFSIGDGKAYIIDLPKLDITGIQNELNIINSNAITCTYLNNGTLQLKYIKDIL